MQAIVNAFWQIALFRQGPDDLPDSRPLLMLASLAYILVDAAIILILYPRQALLPLLLQVVFQPLQHLHLLEAQLLLTA